MCLVTHAKHASSAADACHVMMAGLVTIRSTHTPPPSAGCSWLGGEALWRRGGYAERQERLSQRCWSLEPWSVCTRTKAQDLYVQRAPRQPALPCRPQPHAPRPPPRLAALCPSCLWPGFRRRAGRARKCASRWPRQSSTPWCVHACVRSCGSEPPATLPAAVGARHARRGGRQYGHKARGPRVGRMVASVSWGAACPH